MKLVKYEDLTVEVEKVIKYYVTSNTVLDAIEPILKTFDGKPITKRIATAIEKAYPDYKVYFSKSYSWFELSIWGKDTHFENRMDLNLGYFNTGDFSFENFVKKNQRYYLNKKRLIELEELKNSGYLPKLINSYNTIATEMELLKKSIPDVYPVSSFLKI
jgi:hypothetical protein